VGALVVEDEIKMAALLRRGLEEEGYAVDLAATGADAVWLATENPYDVIALDIMLPTSKGSKSAASWMQRCGVTDPDHA
jgi:two-component system, OmpR family, response regulator